MQDQTPRQPLSPEQESEWTAAIETCLRTWGQTLNKRGRFHCVYSNKLRKYDTWLTVPTLLCGAACSTFQLLLASSSPDSSSHIRLSSSSTTGLQISSVVLSSLMVFSTMVSRHLSYTVNADRNWQTGMGLILLANDIDAQLLLPVHMRELVSNFIQRIYAQRASLLRQEPDLPDKMIECIF